MYLLSFATHVPDLLMYVSSKNEPNFLTSLKQALFKLGFLKG